MIHHHHDHTGVFGAIYAVISYFAGMATGYIPEPTHWYSSMITAASAAFVGWAVTKICNWIWNKAKHRIYRIKWKLSFKKK